LARAEDRFEEGNRTTDASGDGAKVIAGNRLTRPEDDGEAKGSETMFEETAGEEEGAEVVGGSLGETVDALGTAVGGASRVAAGVDKETVGDADAEVPLVGRVGAGEELVGREKSGVPIVGAKIEGLFGELVGRSEVEFDDERTSGLDGPGRGEGDAGGVGGKGGGNGLAVKGDEEVATVERRFGREFGVEGIEWGAADVL